MRRRKAEGGCSAFVFAFARELIATIAQLRRHEQQGDRVLTCSSVLLVSSFGHVGREKRESRREGTEVEEEGSEVVEGELVGRRARQDDTSEPTQTTLIHPPSPVSPKNPF
jgi:hypothetical protein